MGALAVDVYSDVVCPWCFIGSRRLDAALDAIGDPSAVTVRYHPYFLFPDLDPAGVDLRAALTQRFRHDPQPMFAHVEAAARDAGIPLDFSRVQGLYPTAAAHTLLRRAHDHGTQRALADALYRAYFLEGRNIASPAVLVELATQHGFSVEEATALIADGAELEQTRREAQQAIQLGIRGVPLVVLNETVPIEGAESPAVFQRAIAAAMR